VAMMKELISVGVALKSDPGVRCVVLSGGTCKSFSVGIDLMDLSSVENGAAVLGPSVHGNVAQSVALVWRALSVPVLAALKGNVFGLGLQLALGADVRFAAHDAQLSIMEGRHGLIPDCGISVTARGVVRPDVLKLLSWTAATVGAEEALRLGLVTNVLDSSVDVVEHTLKVAEDLATNMNIDALRGMKRLVDESMGAPKATLDAGLAAEMQTQIEILRSPMMVAKMNMLKQSMATPKPKL